MWVPGAHKGPGNFVQRINLATTERKQNRQPFSVQSTFRLSFRRILRQLPQHKESFQRGSGKVNDVLRGRQWVREVSLCLRGWMLS